jgi:hypothetical protein
MPNISFAFNLCVTLLLRLSLLLFGYGTYSGDDQFHLLGTKMYKSLDAEIVLNQARNTVIVFNISVRHRASELTHNGNYGKSVFKKQVTR